MTPLRPKLIVFQKYEFFSDQMGQNRFSVGLLDVALDYRMFDYTTTKQTIYKRSQARRGRRTWDFN